MADYTLAISALPSGCTIKINDVEQSSASIAEGASVSYEISKTGYTTASGTITMPAENTNLAFTLSGGLVVNFMSYAKALLATLKSDELNLVDFSAPMEIVQVLGNKSASFSIDCSLGNIVTFTVGGALTITLTPNASLGMCRCLTMIITNGGAYTITWPTSVTWSYDTAPVLSATGVDILTLFSIDNGTTWFGTMNGGAFA